jgi:hypothetical protein
MVSFFVCATLFFGGFGVFAGIRIMLSVYWLRPCAGQQSLSLHAAKKVTKESSSHRSA